MKRSLYTTGVLAALAAWAAGQGPAPGQTAGERTAQFARNRGLVASLVDRGLELAVADDHLTRATAVQGTAADLTGRLREATAADDPVRTAELAEYLAAVAEDGLVPVFADARKLSERSPSAAEYATLWTAATTGLDRATVAAGTGKAAGSPRVRDAKARLDAAQERLRELKLK